LLADWTWVPTEALPDASDAIVAACGRLPLALAVAGARVRDGLPWGDLAAALKDGLLDFLDHPYGSVFNSLRLSVAALAEDDRARYLELAVFPEDVAIPRATIDRYWSHTAGLASHRSHELLARLQGKGLLFIEGSDDAGSTETPRIRFHDLQRDWLHLSAEDLPALHRRLLDAHVQAANLVQGRGSGLAPPGQAPWHWSCLAADEPYLWVHLAHHLVEAERLEELHDLLCDFRWLDAKLRATDLIRLLEDFATHPPNQGLKYTTQALQLSAHVLTKDPHQLASQLLGRLLPPVVDTEPTAGSVPEEVRCLLTSIETRPLQRVDLRPLRGSLTPPGGPLQRSLEGHEGDVRAVCLTGDSRRAISASEDKTLRVWDLETERCLHTLKGHQHWVTAIALSGDDHRAISASRDTMLRVWDLETGSCLYALEGHQQWITSVSLSADSRRAVSASDDRTLRIWDLERGDCLHTLEGHQDAVWAVSLTSDGLRAVSASGDNTLRVWELETGDCLHTLEGHQGLVKAVAVTADDQRAVSASYDHTLRVWSLARGRSLYCFDTHTKKVDTVIVTDDGQRAVSCSWDNTLRVWDLKSGCCLHKLKGHNRWVDSVSVSGNGHRVISTSEGILWVWDSESGRCLHSLEGHRGTVTAVSISGDGQSAISASYDKTLRIWDLASGHCLFTLEGHHSRVNDVSLTGDNRRAVSVSDDGTVQLWDLESERCMHTFREDSPFSVTAVSISRDGRRAIWVSNEGILRLWDLESGDCLHNYRLHTFGSFRNKVIVVGLTGDGGKGVLASQDNTLRVWDLETDEPLACFTADAALHALSVVATDPVVVTGDALGRVHILYIAEPPLSPQSSTNDSL
jgi:WD40 repeat protein